MISHKQKILASAGIFLLFLWLAPFESFSLRVSMPSAFEWLRRFMAKTV